MIIGRIPMAAIAIRTVADGICARPSPALPILEAFVVNACIFCIRRFNRFWMLNRSVLLTR